MSLRDATKGKDLHRCSDAGAAACVSRRRRWTKLSVISSAEIQSAICVSRSMATLRGKLAKDKHFKSTFKKTTCLRMANITLTPHRDPQSLMREACNENPRA